MPLINVLCQQYKALITLLRYWCLFMAIMQLTIILLMAQIRISAGLGENPYLIITSILLNFVAIVVFYIISILTLKYYLHRTTKNKSVYVDQKSKTMPLSTTCR